tara:strand:+ start:3162 stop:3917 length:756 start_codon:yes stop_codon:yes gene_type:complete
MKTPQKINVLDVGISQVKINDILELVPKFIKTDNKGYVTVTGAHGIIESRRDEKIRSIHNGSYMSIPDGMPCVWVSKLKKSKNIERCFGPEVFIKVMEISAKNNIKHYFYGGNVGIADKLKLNMEKLFPGIQIVGTYCPPFRPLNQKEEKELFDDIEESKPDIVWVGLSTPKQEIFMSEYLPKLKTKLMFGVGAAFDYHTGSLVIAPKWVQNSGLEWLFRLLMEPRRLWKRYFDIVPKFIMYNIIDFIKKK